MRALTPEAVVGCAVALTLTACGTTSPTPAYSPPAFVVAPSSDDCVEKPWRTENPPFAGPGPHLITPVVDDRHLPDDIAVNLSGGFQPYEPTVPGRWPPEDSSVLTSNEYKMAQVQLFACVKPTKGAGPIGEVTCPFDDSVGGVVGGRTRLTFPLYEGDYQVTVREARSGRVVSTLSVRGTGKGVESCPGTAVDTGRTVLLRALDRKMLADTLRPLATAPAPG